MANWRCPRSAGVDAIPGNHDSCSRGICIPEIELGEMADDNLDKAVRRHRNLRERRPAWQGTTPPRGREVETPEVLKIRPLKPPGRR